jgi:hypothetical protein
VDEFTKRYIESVKSVSTMSPQTDNPTPQALLEKYSSSIDEKMKRDAAKVKTTVNAVLSNDELQRLFEL